MNLASPICICVHVRASMLATPIAGVNKCSANLKGLGLSPSKVASNTLCNKLGSEPVRKGPH